LSHRIQRCHDHSDLKEVANSKIEKMGIQVYVRFESMEDRVHGLVNEESLREVFMECGEIEDSIIQRHSQNLWRQKGYGFIFFLTLEGAELAIKTKNGFLHDNVYYQCEYTHKAKEKVAALTAQQEPYQYYRGTSSAQGHSFSSPRTNSGSPRSASYTPRHRAPPPSIPSNDYYDPAATFGSWDNRDGPSSAYSNPYESRLNDSSAASSPSIRQPSAYHRGTTDNSNSSYSSSSYDDGSSSNWVPRPHLSSANTPISAHPSPGNRQSIHYPQDLRSVAESNNILNRDDPSVSSPYTSQQLQSNVLPSYGYEYHATPDTQGEYNSTGGNYYPSGTNKPNTTRSSSYQPNSPQLPPSFIHK
jgi:RNA recognition motif-containing protein